MVRLIMGLKGTGKTKTLVDLVRVAVDEEQGDVVCIEKDKNLTYDIPYQARLVHASEYTIDTIEKMGGFLSGLAAGNYDITHVFIDNLYKIIGQPDESEFTEFLSWLNEFSEAQQIVFTVTVSADPSAYGERVTKFLYQP